MDWTLGRLKLWTAIALLLSVFIAGCGAHDDGEDDELIGPIGTGLILDGTVNNNLLAAASEIEIISSDGKINRVTLSANQTFETLTLDGTSPWLLRVPIDRDRDLLAMAYTDSTRNINAFTDVSLRRWFAQRSVNIDNELLSSNPNLQLPTQIEYDASVASILLTVDLVLQSYEITGEDVISARYLQNDTGVDAFLRRNTVVVDNDEITFQITDPDTNIRSDSRSIVELSDNSVDNGTPPSTPSSVRALNAATGEIVVVWEPSIDDVGVSGYVVLRNGELIGTTPYPQITDSNLPLGQTFNYIVSAVDSAGNSSSPSNEATGSTQAGFPTTPDSTPQSPVNPAIITASNLLIRVGWTQPNVGNVVSYNVYRGVGTSPLTLLQSVATTDTIDTAVVANQTYCYQISAVNTVNQESPLSDVVCANASSSDVDGFTQLAELEDWITPNTDVECARILTTTDIAVGLNTLSDGCYSIPQTLVVRQGATLQIEPGVILKFAERTNLMVEGTLTVLASRDNPVVFTGARPQPGAWGGIEYFMSSSSRNILRGAVVEYAGDRVALAAVASRGANSRVTIEDTLIQFSSNFGVSFNSAVVRIDSFTGNYLFANDIIGNVVATAAQAFGASNQYVDNRINELAILGPRFTGVNIVIPDANVPISWLGIDLDNGSLTIQPGAEIEMDNSSRIEVDGPVRIMGEADNPITIRSRSISTIGTWDGILLRGSGNKVIEHTVINSAGASGTDTGAVHIDCFSDDFFNVDISNTDISDSRSLGIYQEGDNCTVQIEEGVTYSNIAFENTNVP